MSPNKIYRQGQEVLSAATERSLRWGEKARREESELQGFPGVVMEMTRKAVGAGLNRQGSDKRQL